jgi:hypothetical protein
VTLVALANAFLMANILGAITSARAHRSRRQAFLSTINEREMRIRETELRVELEQALAEVKTLRGLLPICAWCKRIRDEGQAWHSVEKYIQAHTDAAFTHGICPTCAREQIENAGVYR